MKKRLSIIGRGTAGCITALNLAHNSKFDKGNGFDIDWYHDPKTPPLSVGEGTDLILPTFLANRLKDLNYDNWHELDAYYKHGIEKINWSKNDFTHHFPLGSHGLHINANKLQNYIVDYLKDKVNIIDKKVKHSDLDTYIVDCSGKQKGDNYQQTPIPVNSAHVAQCSWNKPRFKKTLCIAKKWGWVFLIPLQNRCSVGYIYNEDCCDIDEIKSEFKNILKEYRLVRDTETSLSFKNYYRSINYDKNISYNGNASFFLEPLEATSLTTSIRISDSIKKLQYDDDFENQNKIYNQWLNEVIDIIMLHYLVKPPYKTKFWKMAHNTANDYFIDRLKNYPKIGLITKSDSLNYSVWGSENFKQNLKGLDLYKKLEKLGW